jgi:hypothetical protein
MFHTRTLNTHSQTCVFKTVLKKINYFWLIVSFHFFFHHSNMKRRAEQRERGQWSGVEWSGLQATRFVKRERERSIILPKPRTVYNFSSVCVLFVILLLNVNCEVCCCVRKERREQEALFLCGSEYRCLFETPIWHCLLNERMTDWQNLTTGLCWSRDFSFLRCFEIVWFSFCYCCCCWILQLFFRPSNS